jgi:DNA-binding protein H-NS
MTLFDTIITQHISYLEKKMTDLTCLSLEKLKTIPLEELLKLKPNLDKAIEDLQKDKKAELIKNLLAEAKANGISLDEFKELTTAIDTKISKKRDAKYRNKNNQNETWSGHGRKPKWVEDWIMNGNSLEDLLIEKSN